MVKKVGAVREVCNLRSGLAGAGTSGMSLAGQLLSCSGSNCTATRAAAAGAFSLEKKIAHCEVMYGQRVRDSLWLIDDDIKELDLKKGDGTTIRKAAREL